MTVPAVTLAPATTIGLAALAALVTEAFSDSAAPWPLSAATLAAMMARDDIALPSSHVAYLDGAPVGVALVAVRFGRAAHDATGARVLARTWLATLGVVPVARRSGVARLLLDHVLDEARARGSRAVTLQVHARNALARRLYESVGFGATRHLLGFTLPRISVGSGQWAVGSGTSGPTDTVTSGQWPLACGTSDLTDKKEAAVSEPGTVNDADGLLGARAARPLRSCWLHSEASVAPVADSAGGPPVLPVYPDPHDKEQPGRVARPALALQPVVAPLALPLAEACLAGEAPAARPAWQMETLSLARLAPPAQVYTVVPHGERAVGYVALTTTPDDTAAATLLHIGILPTARRQGWGRAAVDAAFALYPTADSLAVPPLVPASSTLVPFLTACGAIRDPEEHLEMALTL